MAVAYSESQGPWCCPEKLTPGHYGTAGPCSIVTIAYGDNHQHQCRLHEKISPPPALAWLDQQHQPGEDPKSSHITCGRLFEYMCSNTAAALQTLLAITACSRISDAAGHVQTAPGHTNGTNARLPWPTISYCNAGATGAHTQCCVSRHSATCI